MFDLKNEGQEKKIWLMFDGRMSIVDLRTHAKILILSSAVLEYLQKVKFCPFDLENEGGSPTIWLIFEGCTFIVHLQMHT